MNFNPKVNWREIDVSQLPKVVPLAKQENTKQMTDCMLCERTFTVTDELEELCPECRAEQDFMRSISKN